jgi:hypothetical protein
MSANSSFEANASSGQTITASTPKEACMNRRHFLSTVGMGAASSIALPSIGSASTNAKGDIAILREILTTLHPGLYRYASPKSIEAGLKVLEHSWSQQDLKGRYIALTRFLASIKCGHSYPNFFNQSEQVQKALFDPTPPCRLPFAFRWIGEQMVVTQNQTKDVWLPVGSVVKAVNGTPARDILKRLIPYVRADGSNDGKRRALLSASGADEIETFDVLYGLLYGAPKSGKFNIHYRAPNTASDVWADMKPLTWAERKAFIKQADSSNSDKPIWDWTMRPDAIAVLKMDGWALYNTKWDWQTWLNERLDSLKDAKGLIVDIRENEGGLDCGDLILSRLAGTEIAKPKVKPLVRYKQVPEHLNQYLDTWDNSFRNWGDRVRRHDDHFFERTGGGNTSAIAAKAPRINVPTAILTSAQNSSATFMFASLCKSTGLATLVGTTTGGNQRGINGDSFFFARLPESRIEFDVPLVGYFPDGPTPPDAGITPDINVSTTAADIAAGFDPVMAAAISHLNAR